MGSWTKEPWRNMRGFGSIYGAWNPEILREPMVCRAADQYSIDDETFDRIVACVNAMEGIPDPAKFVEAAKALRAISECERPLVLCKHATGSGSTSPLSPSSYCDHCKANAEFDKAIAAKPEDKR